MRFLGRLPIRGIATSCVLVLTAIAPRATHAGPGDGVWNTFGVPTTRLGQTEVLDPVRQRLILFGGSIGLSGTASVDNEVWTMPVSGSAQQWSRAIVAGTPPPARYWHSMVYDPNRDRMLVFGGYNNSSSMNDTWALSLSPGLAWTQLTTAGTPPAIRYGHVAGYDPVNDRMLVFGGASGPSYMNDLWALTFSPVPTWTQLAPSGSIPLGRRSPSLVFDSNQQRFILFGGFRGTYVNDTWSLSLGVVPAWSVIPAGGTPPPGRAFHGAVYDATRSQMRVYEGSNGVSLDDTYALSLGGSPTWSLVTSAGSPPPARSWHTVVRDEARDRDLLSAGYDGKALADLWSFAPTGLDWTEQPASIDSWPMARAGANVVLDNTRNRLLLFGGNGQSGLGVSDVWAWSLSAEAGWEPVVAQGAPPPGRTLSTTIYDPVGDRLIVFGGVDGVTSTTDYGDVWQLTLSGTPTWTQLSPVGTPPTPRSGHTAVYDPVRSRMVVFGGRTGLALLNEVWVLELSGTPTWHTIQAAPPPSARYLHVAAYDPQHDAMLMYGGYLDGYVLTNSAAELDFAVNVWIPQEALGPSPRASATMAYDTQRSRFVMFGGFSDQAARLSEVWAFSGPPAFSWSQLLPAGAVPGRENSSSLYDAASDRMVIAGGSFYNGTSHDYFNEVLALQFASSAGVGPGSGPAGLALAPAAPNPSRADVLVPFTLAEAGHVTLRVYDVGGRLVRTVLDRELPAGPGSVRWDRRADAGERVHPGLYFYELRAGGAKLAGRVTVTE